LQRDKEEVPESLHKYSSVEQLENITELVKKLPEDSRKQEIDIRSKTKEVKN
jgi:hypothetical protein